MENSILKVGSTYIWNNKNYIKTPFTITKIEDGDVTYTYVGEESEYTEEELTMGAVTLVKTNTDNVVNPAHYTTTKISALDIVNDWDLGFYLGNTIKYIKRYKLKGKPVEDLKKAQQYLQLFIDLLEKEDGNTK